MIMLLSADPTHEYGSCGGDTGDGIRGCVWCMHILYVTTACLLVCSHHLTQKLCMSPHVWFLSDMCMYYHIKPSGVKAFMSLSACGWLPWGLKKSINKSVRGAGHTLCPGINALHPWDSCLVSLGIQSPAKLFKSLVLVWQLTAGDTSFSLYALVCRCSFASFKIFDEARKPFKAAGLLRFHVWNLADPS